MGLDSSSSAFTSHLLGRNLPPIIPVSSSLLFETYSLETVFNMFRKKSEVGGDGSKFSCSVTSSLKEEIFGEQMSLIYFLQNGGFSDFPDQASCLEGWDLHSRNLYCRSDPESICGLQLLGGPVALTYTSFFPAWLPGLQVVCLLRGLAFMFALHIESNGIVNGHSDYSVPISKLGPKEEQ